MIQVQIPQVLSYEEDQVALIVEDPSIFSRRCPIILGTPTIFRAIQAMKESEMHNLEQAWQYAKAGYKYTHFLMNPDDVPVEEGQSFSTNTGRNPIDLDEDLYRAEGQKPECVRGSSEPYQQDHTFSPWSVHCQGGCSQ